MTSTRLCDLRYSCKGLSVQLPKTYFDHRKETSPLLFECVRQDLRAVEKRHLDGPFFDSEMFKGFDRVFDSAILQIGRDAARRFRLIAGRDEFYYQQLVADFNSSEAIERITFFLSVDYLIMLNFALYGKKTFFFTDNLIEHLAHTELDAPSSHIRLPFPSCLFVITSETAISALWRVHGTEPQSREPISVFITEAPASDEEGGERKIIFCCYQPMAGESPFFVKRSLLVREDWSIKQMLQTDWSDIFKETDEGDKAASFGLDDEAFYKEEGILLLYRVLLNCILYLQSKDADILLQLSPHRRRETAGEREKQGRPADDEPEVFEESELNYDLVGANIAPLVIHRIIVDNETTDTEARGEQAHLRKLAKRILVRGHWRNQPFGSGLRERKIIWIRGCQVICVNDRSRRSARLPQRRR